MQKAGQQRGESLVPRVCRACSASTHACRNLLQSPANLVCPGGPIVACRHKGQALVVPPAARGKGISRAKQHQRACTSGGREGASPSVLNSLNKLAGTGPILPLPSPPSTACPFRN